MSTETIAQTDAEGQKKKGAKKAKAPRESRAAKRARIKGELGDLMVELYKPNWKVLQGAMVNVELRVSYWRGRRQLRPADFGLDTMPPEVQSYYRRRLRFGNQILMREEDHSRLTSREKRARTVVAKPSVASPFGSGRLVTEVDYPKVRTALEQLRDEFMTVGARVASEYEDMREKASAEAVQMAIVAWNVRSGRAVDVYAAEDDDAQTQILEPTDVEWSTFRDAFVARILSSIPTVEDVAHSFSFEWIPSYIEPPRLLEKGIALSELEAQRDALLDEIEHIDVETERTIKEAKVKAIEDRIALKATIEKEQAEKVQREFNEKVEKVATAFGARVCSTLSQAARDLADSLSKNQYIHPQALSGFRSTIEQVKVWNAEVLTNPEISHLVDRLTTLADNAETSEDQGETRGTLELALDAADTVMRGRLFDLGNDARLGGVEVEFDVPEAIDGTLLDAARARLALDEIDVEELLDAAAGRVGFVPEVDL